jgi:hypothetical protein
VDFLYQTQNVIHPSFGINGSNHVFWCFLTSYDKIVASSAHGTPKAPLKVGNRVSWKWELWVMVEPYREHSHSPGDTGRSSWALSLFFLALPSLKQPSTSSLRAQEFVGSPRAWLVGEIFERRPEEALFKRRWEGKPICRCPHLLVYFPHLAHLILTAARRGRLCPFTDGKVEVLWLRNANRHTVHCRAWTPTRGASLQSPYPFQIVSNLSFKKAEPFTKWTNHFKPAVSTPSGMSPDLRDQDRAQLRS